MGTTNDLVTSSGSAKRCRDSDRGRSGSPKAASAPTALTDPGHWDAYWRDRVTLPVALDLRAGSADSAILEVLDTYVASATPLSVLEIGGAPGGYLVHLWRRFRHDVTVLDYSPLGIEFARRNFEMLSVPGQILERDLFSSEPPIPQFDVVYSLGLIEHFDDTPSVIKAH